MQRTRDSRRVACSRFDSCEIDSLSLQNNKPGTVSRPGANRQFQFRESLDFIDHVKWRFIDLLTAEGRALPT